MNEAVPPTPPIPLRTLLDRADLGLRQVAGPREDTVVYAVHTSEMDDPVPYLLGGELLLTSGLHQAVEAAGRALAGAEKSTEHWERYVARTVQAGAAALGFGVAPVYATVPQALIDACEGHGLPLVEVPRQTPFTAVARAMWQAVAEARHRELTRVSDAQQSLARAAAGANPVPALLRQLAQYLGGWAVLLGPDGAELAAAGPRPPQEVRTELASLAARLRRGPSSAAGTAAGLQLTAYGLTGPAGSAEARPALGVCAERRDNIGGAIASVAVVLLSLLTAPRSAAVDVDRSAALVRLMLGADPARVAPLLASALPGPPAGEAAAAEGASGQQGAAALWTVVHGRKRGRATASNAPLAVAALSAGLGTTLVDLSGEEFRAIVPGGQAVAAQPGWTVGVGPAVPVEQLARSDAEAARALRRAVAERTPLVRSRSEADAGFSALVAPEEARAVAAVRLGPLAGSPALLETLRVWLSLHGSWDRTAVALGIHRNTVRQRIARAAELLDTDLGDPDVRMDLWFALKWL